MIPLTLKEESVKPFFTLCVSLLVALASGNSAIARQNIFYRQLNSPPGEVVSALFSPMQVKPGREEKSNSRLGELFSVVTKKINKNKVYLEIGTNVPLIQSLFSTGSKLKIWISGDENTKEGPWQVRVEGPLRQNALGEAWLRANAAGSMFSFELKESTLNSVVQAAALKAVLSAGILTTSPEATAKSSGP
jgi:hypothetical protein